MATTVSYKNNTIATITNQTKTLTTAGKWLEADIIITDSGSAGASAISITDELDSHGGTIRHINSVDLSSDTVTAAHLESGYTAHDSQGNAITGTLVASGGGSDPSVEKPVKFYDYDGTVLYEYTIAEAKALTALPANPTHTGLTAEGWNWTLQELKDYATAYPQADINIGQTYITSDGATRLHITLQSGALHPYLALGVNGTITVDWGDNTSSDTMTGNSNGVLVFQDHEYSSAGNYIITITVDSGRFTFSNQSSAYVSLFRVLNTSESSVTYDRTYATILTKIFLGENAYIGSNAFANSHSLVQCCIPKNVALGGNYTFSNCYNLKHLTVSDLTQYSFSGCVNLKSLSISKTASTTTFYPPSGTYNLRSLTIPDNVVTATVFSDLYSITKLVLPDSLVTITSVSCVNLENIITSNNSITFTGSAAFNGCRNLSNLSFQVILTSNSGYGSAFGNCLKLSSINYSYTGTSTSTGSSAFAGCNSLIQISPLPSTIKTISGSCFSNCWSLKSFEISSEVTTIENSAFNACYNLKTITLNNKLTSIGNTCFSSCYNLQSISLPNTLTTLGNTVFQNCISLTTLTIPASVTSIGNSCFASCSGMQEYHFLRTTPPTIGTTPFNYIPSGCKIYVPYSADHSILNAYKTATNWSTYADYIEEEPQS